MCVDLFRVFASKDVAIALIGLVWVRSGGIRSLAIECVKRQPSVLGVAHKDTKTQREL
jgi:hypothetical protein